MTITCPKCGFAGRPGPGAPREPAEGNIALCSGCGAALLYVGWLEVTPETMRQLPPGEQQMIRDGQGAIRQKQKRGDA